MAYDESLADRIREIMQRESGLSERKMFGGLAFMLDGHMCCGIVGSELMLRLGPDGADKALEHPQARPMDFTGKPMTGMVYIGRKALDGEALSRWLDQAVAFVRTLPPKR